MLSKNQQAVRDESGRYRVPLRVPVQMDLDFMARALAAEFGRPPQREGGSWIGRVGLRRAHEACVDLVQRRVTGRPELPVDEGTLTGWKAYVVEHFGLFPREALPGDH